MEHFERTRIETINEIRTRKAHSDMMVEAMGFLRSGIASLPELSRPEMARNALPDLSASEDFSQAIAIIKRAAWKAQKAATDGDMVLAVCWSNYMYTLVEAGRGGYLANCQRFCERLEMNVEPIAGLLPLSQNRMSAFLHVMQALPAARGVPPEILSQETLHSWIGTFEDIFRLPGDDDDDDL